MYESGNWQFNGAVAPVFDQHVRQSIPAYEWIQESVVHMTDFFCPEKARVVDLGCATGETLFRINARHSTKMLNLTGVDESHEMLKVAMKKVNGDANYQWLAKRIQDVEIPEKTDMVLSILTLQFMEPDDREAVLERIYRSLKKGGAFVLVEKVYAESGRLQDVFNQVYHDQKEQAGFTTEEIRQKDISLRSAMEPFTVKENEALLQRAGFSRSEVFFKNFHFTGWIAVK